MLHTDHLCFFLNALRGDNCRRKVYHLLVFMAVIGDSVAYGRFGR